MDEINIDITGSDADSRKNVANVIHNALTTNGFNQVNFESDEDEPLFLDNVSLLSHIKHNKPELFDTSITISSFEFSEEDDIVDLVEVTT